MADEKNNNKKEIKIVTGNGEDLEISTVYEHIKSEHSSTEENKKKNIIIPKGTSNKSEKRD